MNYGYGQQYPMYQNQGYSQNQSYGGYSNGYMQGQQANVENTFAWVYSDAHAESFPVAPGKTVLLMHYNEPILYLKSVDMNGRPLPMEKYGLVRYDNGYSQAPQLTGQVQQPQANMNEYVKKSELESQVNDIMNRNMSSQRSMGMNGGNSMQGQGYSNQQMPANSQNWSQNQGQEVVQ